MKPSTAQILRYRFDNFMSKGPKSIFLSLTAVFLVTLGVVSLIRGFTMLVFPKASLQWEGGFIHQFYILFLQMTDPGNMAQDITSSPFHKFSAVLAGIAGVILLSMLIGFITTALVQKMEDLRKGHSKVIENEHTLILGWSEQRVVEILRELVLANESEDNPSVVILAEDPKEEMDDHLALVLPDTENTRVVTRSGSPSSLANLRIAAVDTCRSTIVLATANEESDDHAKALSDARVIKTILAIVACRPEENELNIVAEIFSVDNYQIVQDNCPHPITIVDADEILAKIIVQTSRSEGLSIAYGEILSFDGCEMYFHNAPWNGITFGAIQYHFPDGVPLGLRSGDGEIHVNPPADRALAVDDDLLILAEDDSTIEFLEHPVAAARDLPLRPGRLEQHVENELIIGWNRKARTIINEYADYVLEGSRVDVILADPTEEARAEIAEMNEELEPLTISLVEKDPLLIETLLEAEPSKRDNIIILSGGKSGLDSEEADSRTILILLLLRRAFSEHPDETVNTRLITEVMDSTNQGLVSRAGVKDFIISNRFISMLLAQISEEADIKRVYDDLFEEDGSEIYLKPVSTYFEELPVTVSFADCMGIAQKREEVCLGIKIKALESDRKQNFGVKLIPEKTVEYTFQSDDCLVVVAEDET